MLNRYPFWKYLMLIIIIGIGLLYALPNLYGEDPAIQIIGTHGSSINENTLGIIKKILKHKNINNKNISLKNGVILIRFNNINTQLYAHEVITKELGEDYIIALNIVPSTPQWLKNISAEPMKFGLDLRGGVHFLIKIDLDEVLRKLQEENINDLYRDFKKENISYTKINKTNNYGISVSFQNTIIRDMAMKYLTLHRKDILISNIRNNTLNMTISKEHLQEVRKHAIEQNVNILRNRINQLGVTNSLVQKQGIDFIIVELPGIQDIARAKDILGATATLEFRLVNTNIISSFNLPKDSELKYTKDGSPIFLYKRVILNGDHIIDSTSSMDEYNQPQVNIVLDTVGGDVISNISKDNIGKLMATLFVEYKNTHKKDKKGNLVLIKEEKVINVASIQSRLGKAFRITGISDTNEAQQLALLLRAGALAAPIQIVEEGTIGPTMGQQNINQGFKACLCGLTISIIFMLLFYKKFGLIAISALLCNLVLIIGIMSLLPGATLTMPGIAGILLTLAVAVDANVLINERIKEELRNGYSVQRAIYEGYKRAFSSIFDANVTTLMKVVILYIFGDNAIKGFAITTAIGIGTSMFTAIIGTRAIVNLVYGGRKISKLSI